MKTILITLPFPEDFDEKEIMKVRGAIHNQAKLILHEAIARFYAKRLRTETIDAPR